MLSCMPGTTWRIVERQSLRPWGPICFPRDLLFLWGKAKPCDGIFRNRPGCVFDVATCPEVWLQGSPEMSLSLASPRAVEKLDQAAVDEICARHERMCAARPGGIRANFAWKDLSDTDLRGRNLTDADLTGAILKGCLLQGARLEHAILYGCDLNGAHLSGALLKRADLRSANLSLANLAGADLFEADLRPGAVLSGEGSKSLRLYDPKAEEAGTRIAVFAGANLQGSRLSGAVSVAADFSNALMREAKLVKANFQRTSMVGADMTGADLSHVDFEGADLSGAVLFGAETRSWNVRSANLSGALQDSQQIDPAARDTWTAMMTAHAQWCETGGKRGRPAILNHANLNGLGSISDQNLTAVSAKGAVFSGLDMRGAQLQGANLEGADLRGCNLQKADLRGARLAGAKLSGADLRHAALGPLYLSGGRVIACDLSGANLRHADLSFADLRHARFLGAELSRADFTGADLTKAELAGAARQGAKGLRV